MEGSGPASELESLTEERVLVADARRVWTLWTTEAGLTSWWAPEGLVLTVRRLEPRVGGRIDLSYDEAGATTNPDWARQVRQTGQPTGFEARGVFTVCSAPREIAFSQNLDFGRAGRTQEFRIAAELIPMGNRTRVLVTAQSSASKHWTLLGRANLRGQLERLSRAAQGPVDR